MREDPIINAPIRGLQLMLRTISYAAGEIPAIIPDGQFGADTEAAVSSFQKAEGLPVTGAADEETFRHIVDAYRMALEALSPAEASVYHFPAELCIETGQSHPNVWLTQAMLGSIAQQIPDFTPVTVTGILDPATSKNLRTLQALSGLEITGKLDKQSWNRLSRLYRAMFDRYTPPSQG